MAEAPFHEPSRVGPTASGRAVLGLLGLMSLVAAVGFRHGAFEYFGGYASRQNALVATGLLLGIVGAAVLWKYVFRSAMLACGYVAVSQFVYSVSFAVGEVYYMAPRSVDEFFGMLSDALSGPM